MNRRIAIRSLAGSSLLLPGIVSELLAVDAKRGSVPEDPLVPKPPHFPAKAKRVIFLHMSGGVSHVDTFDYKPRLIADHNQPYEVPKRMLEAFAANNRSPVKFFKKPDWEFKQRGKSGLWISELFPKTAERADDICLIRSMFNDNADHCAGHAGDPHRLSKFYAAQHGILDKLWSGNHE